MGIGFLLARARPYRGALVTISVLGVLGSASTLAMPWLAGRLLGGVVVHGSADLAALAGLLVLALLGTTLLGIAAAILAARTAGRVLADLRQEAYDHVQRLPLAFHDRSRQGDLLALMTYEVSNLSNFLSSTLSSVPGMLLTGVGAVVLLFVLDPRVALVVPLLLPLFFLVLKLFGRKQRGLAAEAREAEAELMTLAEEDLAMLPAIKAFAVEDRLGARYAGAAQRAFALAFRQARIAAVLGPVVALVAGIAAIVLLLAAGEPQGAGPRRAEELFAMLLYAALLTRPVGALADFYGRLQWARGTLARLETVLALPIEPTSGASLDRVRGAIVFEQIEFAYPGRAPLLNKLDLSICAGEIVALTGHNGAGKSTLINLLLRFYAPQAGRITLDGRDIAGLQLSGLRRQIGFVPQRALLFNGSLRDNIGFGMPQASDDQIAAALKLAQAEEFIAAMPRGLDTEIGDHGVRLSGGQRQRVALARSLLPDPPVLVFDEATSMYDLTSEAAFVDACQTALLGRTVIIVTHRQASLALADRIIEIDSGAIKIGDPREVLPAGKNSDVGL